MYDEVKTYLVAVEAAEAKCEAVRKAAPRHISTPVGEDCPGCTAYEATGQPAETERAQARKAAWAVLETSTDSLVRWIAENVSQRYAADVVLKALPASMAELDAIAEQREWCEEYAELRKKAKEAGVLPIATPEASER